MLDKIINQIKEERGNQDEEWGIQNHTPFKWLSIVIDQLGDAAGYALEFDMLSNAGMQRIAIKENLLRRYRSQLIQGAAVIIAAIENLDRLKLDL